MKKKLILGIVAAALSLSLAVGGTLMLFTAQSEIAANVVTIGDLRISLWESGKVGNEDISKQQIGVDGFKGINYGDVLPGESLDKVPTEKHDGGVAAYLRVVADVKVTDKVSGAAFTIADLNPLINADERYWGVYDYITALVDGTAASNANWTYAQTGKQSAGAIRSGYFYYTDGANGYLAKFENETETAPVFEKLNIPKLNIPLGDSTDPLSKEDQQFVVEFLSKYDVTLTLTAQAVQIPAAILANWNDNLVGSGDYAQQFAAIA
jgi:predicted ribosomally synthesized peptide with SipW-like signal peptide